MTMVGRIVERDGKMHVLYESANYSEPSIARLWWLVVSTKGNPYNANRPDLGDVAAYQGDGTWHTHRHEGPSTGSISTGDGRTEAKYVETVPVPRPKVRAGVETRWRDGRWEKLLKSKGWVTA